MNFIITSSDIKEDNGINDLFERFRGLANDREGYCYYKYPVAGGMNSNLPDITIVDLVYGVCFFDVYSFLKLEDIEEISEYNWKLTSKEIESPTIMLEDYEAALKGKYDKYRPLRGKVQINYFAIFPLIKRTDFRKKFLDYEIIEHCKFSDELSNDYNSFWPKKGNYDDLNFKKLFLSVSQGAGRLNDYKRLIEGQKSNIIGEAIKLIDTKIAYLDKQQHAAAIQIPDGPQRIRGMAGTGKTIILTMKAAFLHSRFPDAKILYTFNTQSLYNQIRDLITKFYRENEEKDPNWDNLLILHSWGGKAKQGVYSRTCLRNSIEFIPYSRETTFNKVCNEALNKKILEEYDFVLMDEAQDFEPSYFQLIYALTRNPKRIIFAYDELQSLSKIAISDTGDLFGYNTDRTKKVDFSKGSYNGGIEMDYILHKSYRNPLPVLMTAHSLGLGIYNRDGYMQVIDSKEIWNAIGYEVVVGSLKITDEDIEIKRPDINSVSLARELYNGNRDSLEYQLFENRTDEIKWIADQIEIDIKKELVEPHDIIVVSINHKMIENHFIPLQQMLFEKGIPSIIPGMGGIDRDKFGEKGFVTLSTVFKAKGNEAFIVYVMGFDYLYDYIDFVYARNRAFTSLSRSKGWCRITGRGSKMGRAIEEIKQTLDNIPYFKFKFPDADKIAKKLSQEEHARRLQELKKGTNALNELLNTDDAALELTQEQKEKLKKKLGL